MSKKNQTIVTLNLQATVYIIADIYFMWVLHEEYNKNPYLITLPSLSIPYVLSLTCYHMLALITKNFIIWTMYIICTGSNLSEKLPISLNEGWCLYFNHSSLLTSAPVTPETPFKQVITDLLFFYLQASFLSLSSLMSL